MENLTFGLLVAAVGMSIVFLGLAILICLIKVMQVMTSGLGKGEKKNKLSDKAAAPAAQSDAELMAVISAAVAANDSELIAVISAAVAAMMEDGTSFRVRRIRRITNAPAWSKAGREEQIYSRF